MYKSYGLPSACILVLTVLFASCTQPGTPGTSEEPTTTPEPTHYYLTGHVYDAYNGAPIAGATVHHGSASAASATDGAFSIDLGTGTAGIDQSYGVFANGYVFRYVSLLHTDPAQASGLKLRMDPISNAAYTLKTIHCQVFDTDGSTPITTAQTAFVVLPMNGTVQGSGPVGYSMGDSAYVHTVRRYSSDCLVMAIVEMSSIADSFIAVRTGVDLSGPSPRIVSFVKPSAAPTSLTLSVDSDACVVQGNLETPYGLAPLIFKRTSGSSPYFTNTAQPQAGQTTSDVLVYNPQAWKGRLVQIKPGIAYPGSYSKMLMSTAETSTWPATLAMPALNAALGPNEDPNLAAWTYTYATGVLQGAAVDGGQLYQYEVKDSGSADIGIILSFSASLTLPSWIAAELSNKGPVTMYMGIMDTDIVQYDVNEMALDTYPASSHFGRLTETMSDGFDKLFNF